MLPKCIAKHNLFWNVILRNRAKFHNFNNGLFKTMDILQNKDIIVEMVGKELENPEIIRTSIQINKNKVFRSLLSKLFYYSRMSRSSSKANNFIDSISSAQLNMLSYNQIWKDLLEFFNEENDFDGVQMVHKIDTYVDNIDVDLLCAAQAAWRRGKILDSFAIFSDSYDKADKELKKKILRTLQGLVLYTLEKKGKATVQVVIEGAKVFSQEKNEFTLLVCVWYSLFTSDIFDDRCLAEKILNENAYLQKSLETYIPWLSFLFLRNNEVTNYQRLIETALQFHMDDSVGMLLRNLFNYYYQSGYFLGCSAVFKCCEDLNIKLTHDQLYKYHALESLGSKTTIPKLRIKLPEEIKYRF